MARDNFTEEIKRTLARRVGYYCSYPSCGQMTTGSSTDGANSCVSIGVACHITAAAAGGKRYDPSLTPELRKSIDNGIWMCQNCSVIIDRDEQKYTVDILKEWKQNAELVATTMVERGCSYEMALKISKIVNVKYKIDNIDVDICRTVGDYLNMSCLYRIIGNKIVDAIRDFIVEYSLNSFIHGGATYVSVEIANNSIILINDGSNYNPNNLLDENKKPEGESGGGKVSLLELKRVADDWLYLGHEKDNDNNIVTLSILHTNVDLDKISSCCIVTDDIYIGDLRNVNLPTIKETCSEVFVILPYCLAYSFIRFVIDPVILKVQDKEVIFICESISDGVISYIKDIYPKNRIISRKV